MQKQKEAIIKKHGNSRARIVSQLLATFLLGSVLAALCKNVFFHHQTVKDSFERIAAFLRENQKIEEEIKILEASNNKLEGEINKLKEEVQRKAEILDSRQVRDHTIHATAISFNDGERYNSSRLSSPINKTNTANAKKSLENKMSKQE